MFHLDVLDHTAVATLVSVGHILQKHPDVVLCISKLHPMRQAMVAMGMTTRDKMAWALLSCTVTVTVGSEKPPVPQDISGVQGDTSLATHHFDS